MALSLSSLNKQMAKMSPNERAKFQKLLAKDTAAQKKISSVSQWATAKDKAAFSTLTTGKITNQDRYDYNKTKKFDNPIDVMDFERPAELAGKEVPYTFKWETKPRTKWDTTSGIGDQAGPTITDEKYWYSWFRSMAEGEDPMAYENERLKDELSSVSRWAVDAVNSQKLDIGTFKDTIQQNADMRKDKTKLNADNLIMQKNANDAAWAAVQDQFTANEQEQKTALDALETEWIKMQAERDNLQRQYYDEVKTVLWAKAWGEGAGLTSQLSGKGLSPAMIANATAGVDKKYQALFADAKDNHMGALENLQTWYTNFYESINSNRANLWDEWVAFAEKTFNRAEEFNKDFKTLKDDEVAGMYGPIEKWFKDVWAAQTEQWAKVAGKSEKAAQYAWANPEVRRNILLDNIIKISSDMDMTKFDMSILETAAWMDSFSQALMHIAKAGQSAAATGESSAIGSYVTENWAQSLVQSMVWGEAWAGAEGAVSWESTISEEWATTDWRSTWFKWAKVDASWAIDPLTEWTDFEWANALAWRAPSDRVAAFDSLKSTKIDPSVNNWLSKQVHVDLPSDRFDALWDNDMELAGKYKYTTQLLRDTNKDISDIRRMASIQWVEMSDANERKISELAQDAIKLKTMQKKAAEQYITYVTQQ